MLKTVNRQIFYHIQHGNQKISKSGDILDIGSTENYFMGFYRKRKINQCIEKASDLCYPFFISLRL